MIYQRRNDEPPSRPTVITAYQINNLSVPAARSALTKILN